MVIRGRKEFLTVKSDLSYLRTVPERPTECSSLSSGSLSSAVSNAARKHGELFLISVHPEDVHNFDSSCFHKHIHSTV